MAYEFKKLRDVVAVEAITDEANVLVEENGVIKKVNKSQVAGKEEFSWNELTDKPFDSKIEMVDFYPEETVDFYDGYNSIHQQIHLFTLLEAGKTYVVNFDGEEYECVAHDEEIDETTACVIGNVAIAPYAVRPVDTGEPFCFKMDYYSAESMLAYVYANSGLTHTFSIYEKKEIVTPLDQKYMPEGYPKLDVQVITALPMVKVEFDSSSLCEGAYSNSIDTYIGTFKENETYYVNFDGIEYKCVTDMEDTGDAAYWHIGNPSLVRSYLEDTGLPFLISTCWEWDYVSFCVTEPGVHTFSVYQKHETITPMDSRFIPSSMGAPFVFDMDNTDGYNSYPYFINKEFVDYFSQHGVIPPVSIISTEGDGKLLWTPEFFIHRGAGGVRIDAYNRATEYGNQISVCIFKDEEAINW